MHSTNKTLSAFSTEALNPPTQARYPCLKNFWKMDELPTGAGDVTGDLETIIDSVGGANFTSSLAGSGLFFTAGDGIKLPTFGSFLDDTDNPFVLEDKNTIVMVMGTRSAGWSFTIGPATLNTGTSNFDDGTNAANQDSGNILTGTDEMSIISLDIAASAATGIALSKADGLIRTVITLTKTGVSADVDLSLYAGSDAAVATDLTNIYGIAVFQFTDLPSDIEIEMAAVWMREYWLIGEKVIYPPWLGRD